MRAANHATEAPLPCVSGSLASPLLKSRHPLIFLADSGAEPVHKPVCCLGLAHKDIVSIECAEKGTHAHGGMSAAAQFHALLLSPTLTGMITYLHTVSHMDRRRKHTLALSHTLSAS